VVGSSVAKTDQSSLCFPFTVFEKPKQTEKPTPIKVHTHRKQTTTTHSTLKVMMGGEI